MQRVIRCMNEVQQTYPNIHFHIHSANGEEVARRIDLGLADIGLVFEPFNLKAYASIRLPWCEKWGIVVRSDDPLASLKKVRFDDIKNRPLILSSQFRHHLGLRAWLGHDSKELQLSATYNLIGTAKQMVSEKMGVLFSFEGLIYDQADLVFIPLEPDLTVSAFLIAKKTYVMPKHVKLFWDRLQNLP